MVFGINENNNNSINPPVNNFNSNDMSSIYASHTTRPTESFDFLEEQNSDWNSAPTIYIALPKAPKTNIYLSIWGIFTLLFLIGSIIFWSVFLAEYAFHSTPAGVIEGPFSVIDKLSNDHESYTLNFDKEEFGSCNYESTLSVSSSVRNIPAAVYYYTLTFSGAKGGIVNALLNSSEFLCITMNSSITLSSISTCEPATNFEGFGIDYAFSITNSSSVVYFILTVTQSTLSSDNLPLDIVFDSELWISDQDEDDYKSDFERDLTVGIVGEATILSVLILALITILRFRKKYNNDAVYHTLSQSDANF